MSSFCASISGWFETWSCASGGPADSGSCPRVPPLAASTGIGLACEESGLLGSCTKHTPPSVSPPCLHTGSVICICCSCGEEASAASLRCLVMPQGEEGSKEEG